jgi:hypothetical protein
MWHAAEAETVPHCFFALKCGCNSDTEDVKQNLRGLTTSSDVEHGTDRHFDDHFRSRFQRTDDLGGDRSGNVGVLVIQPLEAAASAKKCYWNPSPWDFRLCDTKNWSPYE